MNRAILDIARATRSPVIDLDAFFAKKSRGGITGHDWLVDHVHPSIQGHQLIANLLADEMVRLGYVHPGPDWIARRDRLYRENLESLDDLYYLLGQKRLGNLLLWAQGRGNRVRGPSAASLSLPWPPLAPSAAPHRPRPARPARTRESRAERKVGRGGDQDWLRVRLWRRLLRSSFRQPGCLRRCRMHSSMIGPR